MAEVLALTALCSDEDVRVYLGLKTDELDEEDTNTLIRLVNAASETFADESQRVWKTDPDADPTARSYTIEAGELATGVVRIEDAHELVSVTYRYRRDPTDLGTTLDPATGWFEIAPEPDHPITQIGLYFGTTLLPGCQLDVTALWGWPVVPEKVRQAVIYTAAEWYARDVEKFTATFSVDQGRIIMPRVLPDMVQAVAESYRRWRVA